MKPDKHHLQRLTKIQDSWVGWPPKCRLADTWRPDCSGWRAMGRNGHTRNSQHRDWSQNECPRRTSILDDFWRKVSGKLLCFFFRRYQAIQEGAETKATTSCHKGQGCGLAIRFSCVVEKQAIKLWDEWCWYHVHIYIYISLHNIGLLRLTWLNSVRYMLDCLVRFDGMA